MWKYIDPVLICQYTVSLLFLDDHNRAHGLQRVAKSCIVLQPSEGLWKTNSKQYVVVCCSVLQCVAACFSVLQRAGKNLGDDDDCFYYHSWRNNVVIAFGTLSSFLT